ncbi:MAG: hypothetical protein HY559_06525 [Gammaproteobacteria bacterium]|nr:hypothetical protein [Gammaproteobacteria bacterium]
MKSKDVDIVCPFEEFAKLKSDYIVTKNPRLKKYEVKCDGFDLDIYVPFYSELGVKPEVLLETAITQEGFKVPRLRDLVILKLFAYHDRRGTLKGEKDRIDILSILKNCTVDIKELQQKLQEGKKENLFAEFKNLLTTTRSVPELEITDYAMKKIKKRYAF